MRQKLRIWLPAGLLMGLLAGLGAGAQGKLESPELVALARRGGPELAKAITATFSEKDLRAGTAVKGRLSSFFFAIEAASKPQLRIDGAAGPEMQAVAGTQLWVAAVETLKQDAAHSFYYVTDGKKVGGSADLAVFGPLAYLHPQVLSGTLSGPLTHTSTIYDGMVTTYWVYVPAEYDTKIPAALLVVQDGQSYHGRNGGIPLLNVMDNLMAQGKMPVTICVFVSPGKIAGAAGTPTYRAAEAFAANWHRQLEDAMRSIEYDTVSDRYPRFLRDELLPVIERKYNVRKDAYSRSLMGLSSGGIASFNAAWQMPDQFSRVISWIGSFVSLQWQENPTVAEGGQDYPDKVLRGPKRDLRVWLQDGSRDQQFGGALRNYGSWPAANFRMANALKLAGYDFRFSFGEGTHDSSQGAAELPQELTWLWRDYDPAQIQQVYEQDANEKARPPFRFTLVDRDTDK